jgi:hypothetical protein
LNDTQEARNENLRETQDVEFYTTVIARESSRSANALFVGIERRFLKWLFHLS